MTAAVCLLSWLASCATAPGWTVIDAVRAAPRQQRLFREEGFEWTFSADVHPRGEEVTEDVVDVAKDWLARHFDLEESGTTLKMRWRPQPLRSVAGNDVPAARVFFVQEFGGIEVHGFASWVLVAGSKVVGARVRLLRCAPVEGQPQTVMSRDMALRACLSQMEEMGMDGPQRRRIHEAADPQLVYQYGVEESDYSVERMKFVLAWVVIPGEPWVVDARTGLLSYDD